MTVEANAKGTNRSTTFRWGRRFSLYGFGALLGVTVLSAAYPPPVRQTAAEPDAIRPMAGTPAVVPDAGTRMDEALRLIHKAQESYKGVRDYTCRMIKYELVRGRAYDADMEMRVRTSPFSVYFRWLGPRNLAGQEVCYVEGRNGGKMRVRASGLRGVVGFVTLEVNDPRALANTNHTINEAGIGNLIAQYATGWERESAWGHTRVDIEEYEVDAPARRCVRVVMTHPVEDKEKFLHYQDVVYFDKENHLPIRMEAYGWPHRPGEKAPVLEMYRYVGLRLNVGLGEESFSH